MTHHIQNAAPHIKNMPVLLTIITSTKPDRLTKRWHMEDNEPRKQHAGELVEGSAERVNANTPSELARILKTLDRNQALVFGLPPAERCELTTLANKGTAPPGAITRTADNFAWPTGPGWLMLDYDPIPGTQPLSQEKWLAMLFAVMPTLERAPMVWGVSGSSCIVNTSTGEQVTDIKGQRLYVLVADARDIPRAGKALFDHLWLNRHGQYIVNKAGRLLERAPIDAAVWQTNRLDFAAPPVCDPPLEAQRPDPQVFNNDAAPLDTAAAIRDLNKSQQAALQTLKQRMQDADDLRGEIVRNRNTWIEQRLATMPERAENRATLCTAVEQGRLLGDFELIHSSGDIVTVATLLENADQWHGERFHDPLEPEYSNADNRIAVARLTDTAEPHIYSHAHGGIIYRCGNCGFAETPASTEKCAAETLRINCGKPLPLPEQEILPPYPLDALGPILGDAAQRMAYYVQAPEGMAGQSVLAAAALVAQAFVNVARGNLGCGPVSLFCLSVAESGDRKSTLDRLALQPVRIYEADRRERGKDLHDKYRAALEAWSQARESTIQSYKKPKQAMTPETQAQLESDLERLEASRPTPPQNVNITVEEPTAEGLWRHYQHGLPVAGLFSDEGGNFFSGHGMTSEARGRTITQLSQLWDGKPITRTRAAEGESGVMADRRLAAHLMMQPIMAQKVLSDPLLLGQGFLARFLVCHDESLAGGRLLADRDPMEAAGSDPAINRYWQTLTNLLSEPLPEKDSGGLAPDTLHITGDAYTAWVAWHDAIETQLGKVGRYADIRAFGSKAAEQIARIAAVLAFVEDSDITTGHIERGGKLCAYYLESMRIRTTEAAQDQEAIQARQLLEWINERGGMLSADAFKSLPSAFRSARKARGLLGLLVNNGHLTVLETSGPQFKPCRWGVIPHV